MPILKLTILSLIVSFALFTSCRENSEDQPLGSNGDAVPAGVTRIYGEIHDSAAQPLSGVALHVVYQVSTPGTIQDMETPSSTFFYYTGTPLTTECPGSTPIPDGVIVKIFWDNDNNGSDSDDPQPPLCANPPECADGPLQTVNFNQFAMNGASIGAGAGRFEATTFFNTVGDVLTPNNFYLRIFCSDGNVLWTSAVMDLPSGASEVDVPGWHCDPCSGVPTNPQWALDQSYPNPAADSVHLGYGLQDAANALLTLEELSTGRVDTLLNQFRNPGDYVLDFSLESRANGLYNYRFRAGTYISDATLLKNTENLSVLQSTSPIAGTGSSGEYRFDTAAEVNINRRGAANQNQGIAFLDHMHVIGIKPGYVTLDTLLAIASEESLQVNLTMQPQ